MGKITYIRQLLLSSFGLWLDRSQDFFNLGWAARSPFFSGVKFSVQNPDWVFQWWPVQSPTMAVLGAAEVVDVLDELASLFLILLNGQNCCDGCIMPWIVVLYLPVFGGHSIKTWVQVVRKSWGVFIQVGAFFGKIRYILSVEVAHEDCVMKNCSCLISPVSKNHHVCYCARVFFICPCFDTLSPYLESKIKENWILLYFTQMVVAWESW